MKLYVPCRACIDAPVRPVSVINPVVANEDGVYQLLCREGHTSTAFVNAHKYEVLFDAGANAFLDGYHREAITSFAASLERYYEYYVRVMMRKRGIPDAEFKKLWKPVARQSERQLGLYMGVYCLVTGKAPVTLSEEMVSLRNDATHKGRLPKREEVESFAQAVMDIIKTLNAELDAGAAAARKDVDLALQAERRKKAPQGPDVTFIPFSILKVTRVDGPEPPFVERLHELELHRQYRQERVRAADVFATIKPNGLPGLPGEG